MLIDRDSKGETLGICPLASCILQSLNSLQCSLSTDLHWFDVRSLACLQARTRKVAPKQGGRANSTTGRTFELQIAKILKFIHRYDQYNLDYSLTPQT